MPRYDAFLLVSFGGPEKPEDVMPFLERVTRGRNIPRARLEEVAAHYHHFGGRSPINDQNRALIEALRPHLGMPIYWGNRNWHPLIEDTMRRMTADGVERALVFVTSAYSSYSACRQYLEDIERARAAAGPLAPQCDKIRHFHNHPGFIEVNAERLREQLARSGPAPVLFTAHSIPLEMAHTSRYVEQLEETARLVAEAAGVREYRLVYQSRSGPPQQPWLGPDILEALDEVRAAGARRVVVAPIGFISDHMEVLYDLDHEAARHAEQIGLEMFRSGTAGTHPRFIRMIVELVEERLQDAAWAEPCHQLCCPAPLHMPPPRPAAPPAA
ncbi:MAG: ferrochelatase [Bryobacteraceae bacterium]